MYWIKIMDIFMLITLFLHSFQKKNIIFSGLLYEQKQKEEEINNWISIVMQWSFYVNATTCITVSLSVRGNKSCVKFFLVIF